MLFSPDDFHSLKKEEVKAESETKCWTNMLYVFTFEKQHFWQEKNKHIFTVFEAACVLQAITDRGLKNLYMYHILWEV